ncbi:hypothetical protein PS685_04187 [Pseudomonas fluorescens]|uniref:Uncharacterized protein n=1 Tax=Pseudomonas fluorescens TaxID=294 RepID=A0A5E6ZB59_PSEFL|nr:hypothetical protein PS685_04187 [Pseudomonas fluorescens]
MGAQQLVGDHPDQREDDKGKALHHNVQANVFQTVTDLLTGQVHPVQEKHQKHSDIDHPFRVHCTASATEMRKHIGQESRQQHAAQKPVGEHSFEMFEYRHCRHRNIVRIDDLA